MTEEEYKQSAAYRYAPFYSIELERQIEKIYQAEDASAADYLTALEIATELDRRERLPVPIKKCSPR